MLIRLAHDLLLLALVALALLLAGCGGADVVVVGHPPHWPGGQGGGEVVLIDDEAAIAEIDAARSLSFSSDRAEHLSRIARRPNLGPLAQPYLADTAFDALSFEDQKVGVLETLIKNPAFCPQAKSRVLERLDELNFSSNRKRILNALDRRGPVVIFPNEAVAGG